VTEALSRLEKGVFIVILTVFLVGILFSVKDIRISTVRSSEKVVQDQIEEANTGPIDINNASKMALQLLDGIGPAKAEAIVKYREREGLFSSKEQITSVSGIGPATYERLRDRIMVSGSGTKRPEKAQSPKIAINKAGKGQLEQLPSIGPVKAQRIVDYRDKKGVFEDYEAITEVNGIGEKTLETIRPLITLQE